jgi:hypothetical protein
MLFQVRFAIFTSDIVKEQEMSNKNELTMTETQLYNIEQCAKNFYVEVNSMHKPFPADTMHCGIKIWIV